MRMTVLELFFGEEYGSFTIDSGVVVTIDPPNVTQSASCFNSNDGHANVIFPINTDFTYTWETLTGTVVDTESVYFDSWRR